MMKKKESDGHLGIGVEAAETTTTTPEKTTVTVAEEGTARVGRRRRNFHLRSRNRAAKETGNGKWEMENGKE